MRTPLDADWRAPDLLVGSRANLLAHLRAKDLVEGLAVGSAARLIRLTRSCRLQRRNECGIVLDAVRCAHYATETTLEGSVVVPSLSTRLTLPPWFDTLLTLTP